MAEIAIAAIGLAVSAAGTVGGLIQGQKAAKAQEKANRIQEQQMNLDAQRQRRETVRKMLIANAAAESAATNQGAANGSGLSGALGQITGNAAIQTGDINTNQQLGAQAFAAQRQYARATSQASLWSGIGSLGGMLTNSASVFGRILQQPLGGFGTSLSGASPVPTRTTPGMARFQGDF